MGNVLVVLDPETLSNPQTDLSILVPLAIQQRTEGRVCEDAWTYAADGCMHLYLRCADPDKGVEWTRIALAAAPVLGNDLANVSIAARPAETGAFTVCYPPARAGELIADEDG